jgi:Xaa-Pro aminopeptidase
MTELEQKTERIKTFLEANHLGGLLLNAQHNFAWLTSGGTNGIDLSQSGGAGSLLVRRDGARFVLANNIEMPRVLAEAVNPNEWEAIKFGWADEKADPTLVAEKARAVLGGDLRLATDIACGDATVMEDRIAPLRYELTAPEIERFRSLGQDAGQAIGELARSLAPGLTEQEVARHAADALAARGAHAAVVLIGADERISRFRHPVPTTKRWEKLLMIVVCARRHGLIVSLTRIICRGQVPDELRQKTAAAARVNARILAETKPGARAADLYAAIAGAYAAEGYPGEEQLHHQGGATGYRTREWVAHPDSKQRVQRNQAFAWNPSITGTKVEETCIALGDRCEIITASPDWPSVVVATAEQPYLLPDVLSV